MKRIAALIFMVAFPLAVWLGASGFTINGQVPGATGAMTPIAVGTSTPVKIISCSTPVPGQTQNFSICSVASQCYIAAAPVASPCAAASPAPAAGTPAGFPVAVCPQTTVLNSQTLGSSAILASEWDAVCSSATSIFYSSGP